MQILSISEFTNYIVTVLGISVILIITRFSIKNYSTTLLQNTSLDFLLEILL